MDTRPRKSLQCPNCGANVAEDCVKCAYCHAVLTITACPSCFGAIFKGMNFCPECGTAIDRHEVDSDKKLKCPRCEEVLATADIAGTRIHECSVCGGIWLDTASFRRICEDREQQEKAIIYPAPIRINEARTVAHPRRFYVPCPECGELMNQKNFAGCSGIVVDICKPHGLWFDRLELQRLVNFIKEGGLHKARENEMASLKAEQDRLREMQYGQNLEPAKTQARVPFFNPDDDDFLMDTIYSICRKIF